MTGLCRVGRVRVQQDSPTKSPRSLADISPLHHKSPPDIFLHHCEKFSLPKKKKMKECANELSDKKSFFTFANLSAACLPLWCCVNSSQSQLGVEKSSGVNKLETRDTSSRVCYSPVPLQLRCHYRSSQNKSSICKMLDKAQLRFARVSIEWREAQKPESS